MKWTSAFIALLLFGACSPENSTPPVSEQSASDTMQARVTESDEGSVEQSVAQGMVSDISLPIRAGGNEPGWSLRIEDDKVTAFWDYGQKQVVTSTPSRSSIDGGSRFTSSSDAFKVVADFISEVCEDDATGMPHPYRVSVSIEPVGNATAGTDSRTLTGCGGSPASLLTGPEWIVEDIDGKGIIDNSRASIEFLADGGIAGLSSCNRYSGSYQLTGEQLTVGTLASTRKACVPALMNQESTFLRILQSTSGFGFNETGALVIRSSSGEHILARR